MTWCCRDLSFNNFTRVSHCQPKIQLYVKSCAIIFMDNFEAAFSPSSWCMFDSISFLFPLTGTCSHLAHQLPIARKPILTLWKLCSSRILMDNLSLSLTHTHFVYLERCYCCHCIPFLLNEAHIFFFLLDMVFPSDTLAPVVGVKKKELIVTASSPETCSRVRITWP